MPKNAFLAQMGTNEYETAGNQRVELFSFKGFKNISGNKANQRAACEKIINFLSDKFAYEMNVKQMEKCSVSQYKDIFVKITSLILGAKTTTNLMEDKVRKTFINP